MALLEKAAGQGHAHAMFTVAGVHKVRNDHEQAVEWFTKAGRCRLNPVFPSMG